MWLEGENLLRPPPPSLPSPTTLCTAPPLGGRTEPRPPLARPTARLAGEPFYANRMDGGGGGAQALPWNSSAVT